MAAVAGRQHGQISTAQLRAAGLTARQIAGRVEAGRLHRVFRGVYAVGVPARGARAMAMAATLAIEGAVLAGRSAAVLWDIWGNARSTEHVIAPRPVRRRAGLRISCRALDPRDTTRRDGIPVTTVARTLLDLAAELTSRQLRAALTRARVRRIVTDDALRDVLARHPRHRGTTALGRALTGPFTRSRLERRFLALVAGAGLPAPEVNVVVEGHERDAVWRDRRLIVEVDGPHHAGEWAADAERDARAEAAGWRVVRLTAWDVERDGARTLDRLSA